MLTLNDVITAQQRTAPYVRRTPLFEADPIDGTQIWIKAEFLQ